MKWICAALVLGVLVAQPPSSAVALEPNVVLRDESLGRRARAISKELRCLVCQNQSIDDSDADLARDLRRVVRARLKSGDSDDEVITFVTARYGDFVLLRPPFKSSTYILWLGPAAALLTGMLAVFLFDEGRVDTWASRGYLLAADVTLTTVDNHGPYGDNGLPLIESDITVQGAGFTIERAPEAPPLRLFSIRGGVTLTLNDVTLRGGSADRGGAIYNGYGTLASTNIVVSGNSAEHGGGIWRRLPAPANISPWVEPSLRSSVPGSSWPKSCAWRSSRWAKSPASSRPTTCWDEFSRIFASVNRRQRRRVQRVVAARNCLTRDLSRASSAARPSRP